MVDTRANPIVASVPTTQVVEDLGKVDGYLAALYRQAAGAEGGASAVPVVRALLFNLIVLAASPGEAEVAALDVSEIAGSHPCRAVVVDVSPARPDEPCAIVTAVCGITQRGDRRLCGEIIRIHPSDSESGIAGLVMPLLIADVPVFIWLPGAIPVGDPTFDELVGAADTVLVDSRRFGDLLTQYDAMRGLCAAMGADCAIRDLAWTSLEPWMELTAQHFDPAVARAHLAELTDVTVAYTPSDNIGLPPSAPLLFLSWLLYRLALPTKGLRRVDGGYEMVTRQGDHGVNVRLLAEKSELDPGGMVTVTIRGGHAGATATFVTTGVSGTQLSISQECEGVCLPPEVLELPEQSAAALAARALDARRGDPAYEHALAIARSLLAEVER